MEERTKARYFIIPFMCIIFENFMHYLGYDRIAKGVYWLAAVSVVWIFIQTIYYGQISLVKRHAEFVRELKNLDYRQMVAYGIKFPTWGIRMAAAGSETVIEGTNILYDIFAHYMRTSNSKQVSPERTWKTKEHSPDDWEEITSWLERNRFVHKNSAAGNHSRLWAGESYSHVRDMYLAPRDLINFGEQNES